ncbi:MAG: DUF2914 domain-containing protein [Pseudobdellovibrio sp.]
MLKEKISAFREKYETRLDILFFIGGFVFDMWMVSAPDELFSIFQQIGYLLLIAYLIHYEILFRLLKWRPKGFFAKVWPYRNLILHFLLGTLLNIYSIFYIKSASLFSSLIFLILMLGFILANELPFVKKANLGLKVALHAICLFSFLSIVFPIAFGFIGLFPFGCAIATTIAFYYGQFKFLSRIIQNQQILYRAIFAPAVSVIAVFGLFYFLGWIPPVPLSVKDQGVFHQIDKRDGKYFLSYQESERKFWQRTNSSFNAEPGDKIYFYAQIYSPARISDQVIVHWFQQDKKGIWLSTDKVPLKVQGGREEGFRGFAYKSNYTAGNWKIVVETSSGIEISRLYFEIISVDKNPNRFFTIVEK